MAGSHEVRGSIPLGSTKTPQEPIWTASATLRCALTTVRSLLCAAQVTSLPDRLLRRFGINCLLRVLLCRKKTLCLSDVATLVLVLYSC